MEIRTVPLEERRAVQVDIDEHILDYLVDRAVNTLLRDFQTSIQRDGGNAMTRTPKTDVQLILVDSFLRIFHASHPNHRGHPILQFRLRLLQFATLYTMCWSQKDCKGNSSIQHLASSVSLKQIDQESMRPSTGTKAPRKTGLSCICLLDTIPSFMGLSAAANAMQESKITETWMRLAAGYMAHAVVEQHVIFEYRDDSILTEAFGWGFDPDTTAKEGSDDWIVNAMFLDDEEEFRSWKAIKNEHKLALIPPNGVDPFVHLRSLQENELSFPAFNNTILQFLKGLLQSLPKPRLVSTGSAKMNDSEKFQ